MVRMTDLLKKVKRQIGPEKETHPTEKEKPPQSKENIAQPPEAEPIQPPAVQKEEVKFAEAFIKRAGTPTRSGEDIAHRFIKASIPDNTEIEKLYFDSVEAMKRIFSTYQDDGKIDQKEIMDIANRIVNNILSGTRQLLKLFHEVDSTEFYLYHNAVNVGILSTEIGVQFNYNKSMLVDLTVIGLLHDIDLIKSKHIIETSEKLNEEELKQIQQHTLISAAFIDNAFNFTKDIVNAVLQHHERKNGQGYPAGLNDNEIQDFAGIVGIADTYESMTHFRPHKEKKSPHTAILEIINNCAILFSNDLIKALVGRVGLYPVGSWVQLNTGEICKVLEINPDFPLRPVISIIMDNDKKKFREIRTINLQKVPSLYIKNIVEKNPI